jgi:hypothetical protein
MATTIRELIEILQKHEDPDKAVIWQYYTFTDFSEELTNKQFGKIADKVANYEIWTTAFDSIKEEIWEFQENRKGTK